MKGKEISAAMILRNNTNAEVGKALNHLGYVSHKTKTCQKYNIEKK